MLLTNVFLNVGKLSKRLMVEICQSLGNKCPALRPLAARTASHLLGINGNTVNSVFNQIRRACWMPVELSRNLCPRRQAQSSVSVSVPESTPANPGRDREEIFRCLLREALFAISHGESTDFFVQSLAKLRLYGIDVGDKYASRQFLQLVEMSCSRLLQLQDAHSLTQVLPGLNVLPPLAICYDGVSIGSGMFSRSESFEVVIASVLNTSTGILQPFFIGCPSAGLSHTGEAQMLCVAKALEEHPAKLTAANLRRRLVAMIAGDGAIAQGGPSARHSSTGSANLLSRSIYPTQPVTEQLVQWEVYHRSESAFRYSISQCEPAQELFALAKGMSQQFGFGLGRVLLRAVASYADNDKGAAADAGGTRQGESLIRIADNLVQNFNTYGLALHAKIARKKEGHGGTSQTKLAVLGRRLLSIDFVVFLSCFKDLTVQPYRFRRLNSAGRLLADIMLTQVV